MRVVSIALGDLGRPKFFDVFKNGVLTVRATANYIRTTGGDVA